MSHYADGRPGLNFTRGGFQGAEGFSANAEWFIEGLEEELDQSSEFLFAPASVATEARARTQWELRYISNSSGNPLPAPGDSFVGTRHRMLFNLSGTAHSPVVGVTIKGLVMRDTRERWVACLDEQAQFS